MQRFIAVCVCALVLAAGQVPGALAGVPLVLSHQGRLLDAADQPVNGTLPITFHLYETLSGGIPVWIESHPSVVVTDGLFDAKLGSITPLTLDLLSPPSSSGAAVERYLEVVVNGNTLSPRVALASTPYSTAAGRVSGDVETSPGELRLHGMSGSTTGTIRMTASDGGNEDSTQLYLYARKDGQFTSADFDYKATSSRSSLTMGTDEDGDALREIQLTATCQLSDGSTMSLTSDPDDDGIANGQAQMKSKGSSGGLLLGGMSGSTTGTIRMAASPDSSYEVSSSLDNQGYGGTLKGMTSTTRSDTYLSCDRASSSTSIEETCDESSARGILSGMSGSTTGTIRMAASPDSTVDYLDMDSDDDGLADASAKTKVTATAVTHGLEWHGSTTGTIRMSASGDEVTNSLDIDDDGDLISDESLEMKISPSTTSMAIKTKGTGAQRSSQTMESWGDSTRSSLDMDSDGDGVSEKYYVTGCTHAKVSMLLASDSDDDGVIDRSVATDCDDTDARLVVANIGSSGQDGVAIECGASSRHIRMGNLGSSGQDGVDMEVTSTLNRVTVGNIGSSGQDGVSMEVDASSRRLTVGNIGSSGEDGVSMEVDASSRRLTVGNIGSSGQDGVSIEVDGTSRRLTVGNIGSSGQDGVAMEVDASSSRLALHNLGSSGQDGVSIEATPTGARLAIDTGSTTHPITVGGGAYCDGAIWTNASDKAAKENFARVDGEVILEQIADLEITRWNYKSQPGVEHIGPTAQDFKAAFGVGENDKSISTIDPSGIALAAIKELQKQNAELRAQLEALNRKVESLSATR